MTKLYVYIGNEIYSMSYEKESQAIADGHEIARCGYRVCDIIYLPHQIKKLKLGFNV